MDLFLAGLILVGGAAIAAAVIEFVLHRFRSAEGDNDAVGYVFTIVGGLHAVLMAFVLISLFAAVDAANASADREANGLVAIGWAADSLAEPARGQIHALSRSYASTVIEHEWPRMRAAQQVEDTGRAQLDELRLAIERAATADDWQYDSKLEASNRLWDVYQARQDRLNLSNGGVGLVVWFALIAGSLLSITLPYLFVGTRLVSHVVMMSVLAATIALLLYAIYQMQNPFGGGASVGPDAFRSALGLLG